MSNTVTPYKRARVDPMSGIVEFLDTAQQMAGRLNVGTSSTQSGGTQSESRMRMSNSVTALGRRKNEGDGSREFKRKASGARAPFVFAYKTLVDSVCPPWTHKNTCVSSKHGWNVNQELVLEYLLMDKDFVRKYMLKSLTSDVNPFNNYIALGNTDGYMDQMRVKFEGGKFAYTIINTCTNTVYLEFREYKLKGDFFATGHLPANGPLRMWQMDQYNSNTPGELTGIYQGDQLPYSNNAPGDDDFLAKWLITAQSPDTKGLVNAATIPPMKRPQKCSPQLHKTYDLGPVTKVTLHPGDTFVYETRVNHFFLPGIKAFTNESTSNIVQPYSRFVQVFCRSEFNVDNTDSSKMAPGPGNISVGCEYVLHWRGMPQSKKNMYVESSDNYDAITAGTSGTGGWSSFLNANATTMNIGDTTEDNFRNTENMAGNNA